MEARMQLFGHPIHQMLIVFPLGVLAAGWLFDLAYWLTDNQIFATVAFWNIAAGVVGGLVAAVFGLLDWLAIPGKTRAKRIGAMHGSVNFVVLVLFTISWLLRLPEESRAPSGVAFALTCVAFAFAGVGGWLGGELVNRHAIGVKDGAGLDADFSNSGKGSSS